mgnify:CR=1 FL=1
MKKVKNINLVKHSKRSRDYLDYSDEFYDDDGKSFHDVFGDDDSEGDDIVRKHQHIYTQRTIQNP